MKNIKKVMKSEEYLLLFLKTFESESRSKLIKEALKRKRENNIRNTNNSSKA